MAKKLVQGSNLKRRNSNLSGSSPDLVPVKQKGRFSFGEIQFLKRATSDDWIRDGTFHDAVGGMLTMAQMLSVMPVSGIMERDPAKVRFTWLSKRIIYCYAVYAGTAFLVITTLIRFFEKDFSFGRLTTVFFYSYNLYGMYCFVRVAQKWPELIRKWHDTEQLLPQSTNILERGVLARKIKLISILLTTLSLLEHLLSIVSAVFYRPYCPEVPDPMEMFFKANFFFVFQHFEYSNWLAFIIKYLNVVCTFVWSYIDLFVMVISLGLSHTFERINDFMRKHKRQPMTEEFWGDQRRNYRNVCDLIQHVDDVVSIITMLSISNNLFFICASILNSLSSHPTIVHTMYFWFGLTFLIARTLGVTMCAAKVNDESRRPIEVLRTIPREGWCLEAKRFAEEVVNDTVALTGMKFFNMTRKLVLKVTGSIITYELVLIQFHKEEPADVDLCKMKRA
ncbi:gustatory receptor for sugar taste 64f-like [Uranotaenia lowii]|uniref:gustatory receptor for sugar taste 64f-like n=1 Tax=Uranotaenia lowii TaxID=190385 RepID=UPI0024786280|nr:gustatory receptor for sugar taste 64f-like [Uranotaenia lowii]